MTPLFCDKRILRIYITPSIKVEIRFELKNMDSITSKTITINEHILAQNLKIIS